MECLGIPIDHRLIRIIKDVKCLPHDSRSSHLSILNTFSRTAKRRGEPIPVDESHHTAELAGPDTKGGVLVTLLRPPRNQRFDHGYTAEVSRCRTTNAVASLIETATNKQLTIDDVSVFDTLPHSPEGTDDDELVRETEATFNRMVKAKKPDVILCCYKGKSSDEFIRSLRSLGVGKVFSAPRCEIMPEAWRINAFHPSYAVNYHRTYSCFRRLLLLEFTHAFYHYTAEWREEPWMASLRSYCCKIAEQVSSEQKLGKEHKLSRRDLVKARWESIISELGSFRLGVSRNWIQSRVMENNLTWHCADAYLFLEKYGDADNVEDYATFLLDNFQIWCERACEPAKAKVNNGNNSRGYIKQRYLTAAAANISDPFIQSCFI